MVSLRRLVRRHRLRRRTIVARRSRRDRLPPGADQDAMTQQFRGGL